MTARKQTANKTSPRPAKRTPSRAKKAPDATSWAQRVRRPPTPEPEPELPSEVSHEPLPAPEPEPLMPRRRRPRIPRFAATYRLPADVLDLIDDAVIAAADRGERLTKERAVEVAVRAYYGSASQQGDGK